MPSLASRQAQELLAPGAGTPRYSAIVPFRTAESAPLLDGQGFQHAPCAVGGWVLDGTIAVSAASDEAGQSRKAS